MFSAGGGRGSLSQSHVPGPPHPFRPYRAPRSWPGRRTAGGLEFRARTHGVRLSRKDATAMGPRDGRGAGMLMKSVWGAI